jgi:protein O-mannosyl-transferase
MWSRPHMDLYIPVTYTVWGMTAKLAQRSGAGRPAQRNPSPLNPHVFHALNLALHAAAACVVLLILRRLIHHDVAALAGALVFALHPVQVEPVAWVSGAKDVLFALLSLVALWQYIEYVKTPAPARTRWRMVTATLAFVLAMLSKPTAIVTPLIAVVIDRMVIGRTWRDVLRTVWPWFVLAAPCALWTRHVQRAELAAQMAPSLFLRPLVALDAIAFYVWKLVWPATLTFDYGRTPQRVIEQRWIAWTWIVPAVLAVAAIWLARRRDRMPAAAGLVFVVVLLPVLGFVPFDFQAYSTVADHYVYLAMFGVAMFVAWVIEKRGAVAAYVIMTVAIVAFAGRTFAQTWTWRDSRTFFSRALEINPRSFVSLSSLAAMAMEQGAAQPAIELSQKALAIHEFAAAYLTLADAHRSLGDGDAALKYYQRALQAEPDYGPALNNLAAMLAERGQLRDALPYARRAAALQPDSVSPQLNLGRIYFQLGQADQAREQFQKVLALDPANAPARELLSALP